jgi:signal transduction histidine kinase
VTAVATHVPAVPGSPPGSLPGAPRDRAGVRTVAQDLRDAQPLAVALIAPLLAVSAMQTLAFDLARYGLDRSTAAAAAASLVAQGAVYLLLALPTLWLAPSALRVGVGAAAYVAAAIAKSVGLVVLAVDAPPAAELASRLPGDATFAALLWIALATAVATRTRHAQTRAHLEHIRGELSARRTSRTADARAFDDRLRRQALEALGPELADITAALGRDPAPTSGTGRDRADLGTLPADLEQLIERRVRPLARALSAHADLVERIASDLGSPAAPVGRVRALSDLRLDLRTDLRVTGPYLAASLNILATVAPLATPTVALTIQAASLVLWLGLVTLRRVWPRGRTVGTPLLLVALPVLALPLTVPLLGALTAADADHPGLAPLRVTAPATVLLFVQIATVWTALRRRRDEELAEVSRVAAQLDRELALLDQAAWVAQRRWSTLIHGTVQGALTVARARLLADSGVTSEVIARVRADVDRARSALEDPAPSTGPTGPLLDEIAAAWEGLCAVEVVLEPGVLGEVDRDATSATCLVELVKELVSNAHRHGGATSVRVDAALAGDHELLLTCRTDGAPIPDDARPGLGFRMFDELTRWWRVEDGGRTVRAALPLG